MKVQQIAVAAATALLFKLSSIIRETVTFERPMQFRFFFLRSGFYDTAILFSATVLLKRLLAMDSKCNCTIHTSVLDVMNKQNILFSFH